MQQGKKNIGIVGLGIMGRGMADNFLKQGYQVFVWNRTKTVAEAFKVKGATVCETPAEVAKQADMVFEVTANDESSKEVWTSQTGIMAGAKKETILVASSTLSIDWVDNLIAECQKRELTFFDMAMTGGRVGAETGKLTLLCGGDATLLEDLKPTLAAVAINILHFGPAGQGMRYKLILNFIQATHIVAFGQAMKMAVAHNMDLHAVSDALADRPGGIVTGIAGKTYFQEPNPVTFSIEWITKDLTYAKRLAENLDIKLLDEVLSQYQQAIDKGFSSRDWASINTLS